MRAVAVWSSLLLSLALGACSGSFAPAHHTPLPLIDRHEGVVLAAPELVTVTFPGYAYTSAVEDLAQRTFLACLEAADRIREDGSFRAYLFGIARKVLLQHFARVRRDGNPPDPAVASADALGASPSRVIAQREEQRLLLRALRKIPLDLQIAIELFYWEELSIAEIAARCGVSREHGCRSHRRHFGVSPSAARGETRLRLALALLAQSSLTLAEVALEAGYADQAHLTRRIRAATGRTPGEVRRSSRGLARSHSFNPMEGMAP